MQARYRRSPNGLTEQLVISLIRLAAEDGAFAGGRAFIDLAGEARRFGLTILPHKAPSLSLDEVTLLACLAGQQRRARAFCHAAAPELEDALARCAAELNARAIRLPYRAIQRLGFVRHASLT